MASASKKQKMNENIHEFFMSVAENIAKSSQANRKIGACIVSKENQKVVGEGYNSILEGTQNIECHSVLNAITHRRIDDLKNCVVYTTEFPCNECAKLIAQFEISEVYYLEKNADTNEDEGTKKIFDELKIKYEKLDVQLFDIHQNFMSIASRVSESSKDERKKVGACVVKNYHIVATGYNCMPQQQNHKFPFFGDAKLLYVCHAELNAIANSKMADLKGCILYVTYYPCDICAKLIALTGIATVYYNEFPGRKATIKYKPEVTSRIFQRHNISEKHLNYHDTIVEIPSSLENYQ